MYRALRPVLFAAVLILSALSPASARHMAANVKVVWWTQNDPAFVPANKALITAFEKRNPGITIVLQPFPYDVFIKKLITGYASHTAPDVAQMFGTWVTAYARAGQLDPVPPSIMTPAQMAATYWPASLGAYAYQGHYYGIPHEYNLENGGMLVNTQLWHRAGLGAYPRSWNALTAAAGTLARRDSHGVVTRAGIGTFDAPDDAVFIPFSMVLQQGGRYFARDGVHVALTSPQMLRAVTAYTNWYTRDRVGSYALDSNPNAFGQGRMAIAYDGPWVISQIKGSYPALPFDYVPFPSFTAAPPYFAAESGWGEVVSRASKVKAAAWRFVQFLSSRASDESWNIRTVTVPARKDLFDDPRYLQLEPRIRTSFHVLRYGRWIGNLQNRDRFFTIMYKWITAIELHKATVAQALANCQSEENKMIDEYVSNF